MSLILKRRKLSSHLLSAIEKLSKLCRFRGTSGQNWAGLNFRSRIPVKSQASPSRLKTCSNRTWRI